MIKKIYTAFIGAALVIGGCFFLPPYLKDARQGSTVRIDLVDSLGSGVHIGKGRILTAGHVVNGVEVVDITKQDGTVVKGKVLWFDPAADLGMVQIEEYEDIKPKKINCEIPEVAEKIVANGNPLGINFVHMWGYIAGKPRELTGYWEQVSPIDMTVIPGMSGGPVYNDNDEIVGITVGVKPFNNALTGLGFMVPGNKICEELKEHNGN